jgi:hypothetical protein
MLHQKLLLQRLMLLRANKALLTAALRGGGFLFEAGYNKSWKAHLTLYYLSRLRNNEYESALTPFKRDRLSVEGGIFKCPIRF